jgi:hypothetical protein
MQEERLTNIALTYANDLLCDGAGSQLHRIYGVYGLARMLNISYYHSPLKKIGYQGMVALEKNENSLELLDRYNQLFHIPSDVELPSEHLQVSCVVGDEKFLADMLRKAKEEKDQFLLIRMVFVTPLTDGYPEVFRYAKERSPFKKRNASIFRIAIHVRLGDLLIAHRDRIIPNFHYVEVAQEVIDMLKEFNIPFICELHTEFPEKPLLVTPQHHGVDDRLKEPMVLVPEQYGLQEFNALPYLEKHFNEDPIKALEALATADLLIMSRSSFSYLAAILNQTGVPVYFPFWHPRLPEWLEWTPRLLFKKQLREFCKQWKERCEI